jgi:hypothetical protein
LFYPSSQISHLPPQQTDIDTAGMCQTPSPNATVAFGVKALTCQNSVRIDPIVLRLEGKQLATQAGFLTHLASQCLTVVIKLFHRHCFRHQEHSQNGLQSDLMARPSLKVCR